MANPMRRKLCGLAVAGACSVIVAAGSAPKVHAQAWDNAGVRPQNVSKIKVPYDEFFMADPNCTMRCRWVERGEVGQGGQLNNFVERNRDGSSIYLVRDDDALIQFDLAHGQVLHIPRDNRMGPEFVAKITETGVRQARADDDRPWQNSRTDDDRPWQSSPNALVIDVRNQDGSIRQFRMTQGSDGRRTWIERGRGDNGWQTHHEFVEEARDDRSIRLFDRSRGENGLKFHFDLPGRQVLFISPDADRRPEKIYEIVRISDRSFD